MQMNMSSLLGGPAGGGEPMYVSDTAETVNISALALLKMLKHGRAGVPLEVMGLMLGSYIDDYTVDVVDVFAMPQSGTGVSVEAVDPLYQKNFLDMLEQTGRKENVVGWWVGRACMPPLLLWGHSLVHPSAICTHRSFAHSLTHLLMNE